MYGSKQGRSLSTNPIHAVQKTTTALSVNVFSSKVLIGDTIFYVCYWRRDRHFARSSKPRKGLHFGRAKGVHLYLHFSVILRPGLVIRPRESNPRPSSLLSNALPTELTLPLNSGLYIRCRETDLPLGSVLGFNRELKHATKTATTSKNSLKKASAPFQTSSLLFHHAKFVNVREFFAG